MNDGKIIDLIGELDDLFFLEKPATIDIEKAQNDLGLRFAEDYKIYVSVGGAICGGGIELTGVTEFDRLNVVKVTQRERRINHLIPDNMYVVEVVGIDGMVVLQDKSGTIYTVQPNVAPKKLFDSLIEYIERVGRFAPNNNARSAFRFDPCDEFGQDLVQRMENGLMPLLPSGKTMHLHHMGLSSGMPIAISPLVEFTDDEYYKQSTLNTLFNGFKYNDDDRVECIKQKQNHWNRRSESF